MSLILDLQYIAQKKKLNVMRRSEVFGVNSFSQLQRKRKKRDFFPQNKNPFLLIIIKEYCNSKRTTLMREKNYFAVSFEFFPNQSNEKLFFTFLIN
jgi:hypothetical protein